MNKTTILAVVAVVVLGVAAFLLTRTPEPEQIPGFSVPAFKVDSKTDATGDDEVPKDAQEPVDKIVFVRKGVETTLEKVDDETWKVAGKNVAFAETYRVRAMLSAFKTGAASNWATRTRPEDLPKYGLDEANRIAVSLFRKGDKVVDILVGNVSERGNDGIDPDTTIMPAGSDIVYRMKEADLRSSFDVEPGDLRDKRLFAFKKDDVLRLTLEDPREARYPKVVIERAAPADKPADDKTPPEPKADWKLVEPKNVTFELENVDAFVTSLASVRATEFMKALPGADAQALDKPYRLTATYKGEGGKEESVALLIGAGRKKGVYTRVEGRDEIGLVAKYSAEQLMKSLSDLRQKKLASFKAGDIESIDLVRPDGAARMKKSGEDWSFTEPAGEAASSQKIKTLAGNIASFRVAEYLSTNPPDSETGLSAPQLTLTVGLSQAAGAGTFGLVIGKEFKNKDSQERFYARLAGTDEVFSIMKYSANNVMKAVADLKDTRVFRFEKEQISEVTIAHPDETLTLVQETKDGKTAWKMTAPKQNADPEVNALLSTLTSLDVSKFADGKKPEEVGLTASEAFTVTVKLTDGTAHSIQVAEEVEDNENYAQTTTEPWLGGKILKISKYKIDNLNKKAADFEKKPDSGAPVPMPMM